VQTRNIELLCAPTNCLPEERREVSEGISLHDSTNESVHQLIDFADGTQMVIMSTYLMHKRIHLETWHFPDDCTYNQIEHCLIDERHFCDEGA
jgi:hypothetical protein